MIGIIVATHDHFGKELLKTAESIVGTQEDVITISVAPGTIGMKEHFVELGEETLERNDELLWLVDIFGGTPFRYVSQCVVDDERQHLVTGVNLPMLMEALMNRKKTGSELAELLVSDSQTGIRKM
ncbi:MULTISPECIES: PTS sugar transporter subunit IIA [Enterococcus]|uniref:PTS mannose/fructose/sorbose family IIA subunit n=1 Tax=Enterococcus alishanensis TaxID=1303817 RepID=A0ABS6TGR3_9ENTE|nr:PTS mannose/fructose/sorbose family IIA subunit [Enterococcus alishanensis]MBV7392149.1 PTS mannose/fructose/sorbose family IIA subunit [Enterococcus alishanensis]